MSQRVWLVAALAPLVMSAAACGGRGGALGPAPLPQACRTHATAWTTTSTFGQPAAGTASFDSTGLVYEEHMPAGTGPVVRRIVYASVADFVDEPAVVGRVLSLRTESCPDNFCGAGLAEVTTEIYDQQRRLTGSTLSISRALLSSETYTSWDEKGRPTGGTRSQPGLCTVPIAFVYDEAARTVSIGPSGPALGQFCIGLTYATVLGYDADGNLVSEGSAAGGTGTTTTRVVTASQQLCK